MGSFLAVLFLIVCILLIVVVLLQKGRGGGLGAAFGGAGSSAFGTKTGDVFTWVTITLTGLFLLLAIITTLVYRPEGGTVAETTAATANITLPSFWMLPRKLAIFGTMVWFSWASSIEVTAKSL